MLANPNPANLFCFPAVLCSFDTVPLCSAWSVTWIFFIIRGFVCYFLYLHICSFIHLLIQTLRIGTAKVGLNLEFHGMVIEPSFNRAEEFSLDLFGTSGKWKFGPIPGVLSNAHKLVQQIWRLVDVTMLWNGCLARCKPLFNSIILLRWRPGLIICDCFNYDWMNEWLDWCVRFSFSGLVLQSGHKCFLKRHFMQG